MQAVDPPPTEQRVECGGMQLRAPRDKIAVPNMSGVFSLRFISRCSLEEAVSKLGKQQKKWYGERGYSPWSPHPTLF